MSTPGDPERRSQRGFHLPGTVSVRIAASVLLFLGPTSHSCGEVTLDGTVGPRGEVPRIGDEYRITHDLGTQRGQNLFHSFSAFNLSNESAVFLGPESVARIVSRVTGGEPSSIDGTIRSGIDGHGPVSLYFLNPNGVDFGPRARLEGLDAFRASTADYLLLGDSGRFDATNPADSILAAAAPSAFGFLSPGAAGVSLHGPAGALGAGAKLQVRDRGGVSLIGGAVDMAGQVVAPNGRIDLASVASAGEVRLDANGISVTPGTDLGPITLSRGRAGARNITSCASLGACSSGAVYVRGGSFSVDYGGIDLSGTNVVDGVTAQVRVSGTASLAGRGAIATRAFSGERAGEILIEADRIILGEDSRLDAIGRGGADGGRITLAAREIAVVGSAEVDASAFGPGSGTRAGSGGAIRLEAESVRLADSTVVTAGTRFAGAGDGGEVTIVADGISLSGDATVGTSSIGATDGDSGNVTVQAGSLDLSDRSGIVANTFTAGGAGQIRIEADNLSMSDMTLISSESSAAGDGGTIVIDAGRVVLNDEAAITSGVLGNDPGSGNAGSVLINAGDVALQGRSNVSTTTESAGNAGAIRVAANRIAVSDEAFISSSSTGSGNAGDIQIIAAERVDLAGGAIRTAAAQASGGNVDIQIGYMLNMLDAEITTSVASGEGRGGDISIDPDFVVLNASRIVAQADAGTGGNIRIVAGSFVISADSVIDASARTGIDGTVEVLTPSGDAVNNAEALSTDFLDASSLVKASCAARTSGEREGSFVVSRRRGLRPSPLGPLSDYGNVARLIDRPAGAAPALRSVDASMGQAAEAFRGGRLEEASAHWSEASRVLGEAGETDARGDVLRGVAETQHALGAYADAERILRGELEAAERSGDRERVAQALGALGSTLVARGEWKEAQAQLARGVAAAEASGEPGLAASLLNNLGNSHALRGHPERALPAYERSIVLAGAAGSSLQQARGWSNLSRAALQLGDHEQAIRGLARVKARLDDIEETSDKAGLMLQAAHTATELAGRSPRRVAEGLHEADALLTEAQAMATRLGDRRALSYIVGFRGGLYQIENRLEEALYLTRRAIRLAEAAEDPESAYRWHRQEGQLLWSQGRPNAAIRSFSRAVAILDETRQESRDRYGSAPTQFREVLAPVYLELVNALLAGAGMVSDPALSNALLGEAVQTVERLKAAELRDYFRDDCIADLEGKSVPVELVSEKAAVVYPIMLPDRLEILLKLAGGVSRYTVQVEAAEVERTVRELRKRITERRSGYLPAATRLYRWMVAPYESALAGTEVETLVFVPDGALREVPLAALHDGDGFLIDRYALAVTPTVTLTDPQPLRRENPRLMLAGVSEGVQGFEPLANVPRELTAIQRELGGDILLDADFTKARFAEAIRSTPLSIVHIASHAKFLPDAGSSFLLTHDGRIQLDELHEYVGVTRFRERPLELLVLSACETAAGDDRAAMGLTGIAIKAGARSALGTLWSISDEATAQLLAKFYRQLRDPSLSKAEALRQAQLVLRRGTRYAHPFFWAPFLLVNNWL